jgi:transposase
MCGSFFPKEYVMTQRCGNAGEGYVIELLSTSHFARCPSCKAESKRAHSYQDRKVRDLPILGESVTLLIAQKRYFCDSENCGIAIFTETTDFVSPYYQFTERCRAYMLKVTSLVSSEAASKILAYQGIRVSGDTLLNMLKAAGETYRVKTGRKIGVDDWAYRKGQKYGTLICDLETHEVIDVLEGRDRETFEKWLQGHPDIEIVSRDRASSYASAVEKALPQAIQVADRFHITKNLLETLDNTMKSFLPEVVVVPNDEPTEKGALETDSVVKKTQKHSNGKLRR